MHRVQHHPKTLNWVFIQSMNRLLLLFACLFFLIQCKEKKSLSGEDPVDVEDFVESFKELKLPFLLSDTTLAKKSNDSSLISLTVFKQFVPDSILIPVFGKNVKPKIYPIGRVHVAEDETYLLAKAMNGDRSTAYIIALNGESDYAGYMHFLRTDADRNTQQISSIDRQYSIHRAIHRRNAEGNIHEGKDVFGYNKDARKFMLIMTESLDDAVELINPIDTLPKKNKYSADYYRENNNLVSIRDARGTGRFRFFIHINNADGDCTGELKGEAAFQTATTAFYHATADPCVLQFSFTANGVTLREVEPCGTHRSVRCLFEGNFSKKKPVAKKPVTTKPKKKVVNTRKPEPKKDSLN